MIIGLIIPGGSGIDIGFEPMVVKGVEDPKVVIIGRNENLSGQEVNKNKSYDHQDD